MATRPSPTDLATAHGREIPDVIAPDLAVLVCGLNPGLWSARRPEALGERGAAGVGAPQVFGPRRALHAGQAGRRARRVARGGGPVGRPPLLGAVVSVSSGLLIGVYVCRWGELRQPVLRV